MARIYQRNSTVFVKDITKSSGKIVSMVVFGGRVYLASEKSVWMINSDNPTRLIKCKFKVERNG